MGLENNTVFVVDDSPTLRHLISHMVQQLGWQVQSFQSALECFQQAVQTPPAMVLVSYEMEAVRGDEACRWFKGVRSLHSTPIVIMGSGEDPIRLQFCHHARADDFLTKPIQWQQLAAKLQALLPGEPRSQLPKRTRTVLALDAAMGDPAPWRELEYAGFTLLQFIGVDDALERLREIGVDAVVVRGVAPSSPSFEQVRASCAQRDLALIRLADATSLREPTPQRAVAVATVMDGRPGTPNELVRRINVMLKRIAVDVRSSPRVPFYSAVEFRAQGEWRSGYCTDLSRGGLFIRTLTPLPTLTDVELSIDMPGHQGEKLRGVVAWERPFCTEASGTAPAGMGLRFSAMTSTQEILIERLLGHGARTARAR
jgi:uncharacterized protein (TIGR02266 family)